jgi:hypothetical protein
MRILGDQDMSIIVQANPDGTFNVTCGNQSVTVGVPSRPTTSSTTSSTTQTRSGKSAGRYRLPTKGTLGGVTAQIFPTGIPGGKANAPHFLSIEAYAQALSDENDLSSLDTVRFALDRGHSIDFSAFEKVAKRAGLKSTPRIEILTSGPKRF